MLFQRPWEERALRISGHQGHMLLEVHVTLGFENFICDPERAAMAG